MSQNDFRAPAPSELEALRAKNEQQLSERDFYRPTDLDALRMENELLAFEVRFLKVRLGASGRGLRGAALSTNRVTQLEDAERHLTMVLGRLSTPPFGQVFRFSGRFRALERRYLGPGRIKGPATSPERLAQLEEAERDLTALVRRLSGSPFGRVLRTRPEFRLLEQRYLRA